jgi:ribosomal protein S18 acetylase RimI-like enzyme
VLHELTPVKFEQILQQPHSRIWVAEQRHHLVGFVELDLQPVSLPDQIGAEIVRLYIQQLFQRQGIGKQLLQQVEQYCRIQQITAVWLSTWVNNQSAIAFYQKQQFTCTGTIDFELDQERHENLVLVKKL